jgi:ribonuclease R
MYKSNKTDAPKKNSDQKHKSNRPQFQKKYHGKNVRLSRTQTEPRVSSISKDTKILDGIISINTRGVGYIRPLSVKVKTEDSDFLVEPQLLNTALSGDTVRAKIISHKQRTAEVEQVLIRAKAGFSGILSIKNGITVLEPSDIKMYTNIEITNSKNHTADVGKKVFVTITHWTDPKKMPLGLIEQVLGVSGENNTEMRAIALERGFSNDFPPAVEIEAKAIKERESLDMLEQIPFRRDMRKTTTFTIDPFDAKDFDDALSVVQVSPDIFEIGIHIADVSHYIRPDTALDREAFRRATSVYLVDRTIPMLPEILSNDLCSLKPNVDRLAMSAIFTMNKKGDIISEWYGKTIIHSDKRFTYEEAQEILDTGSGIFFNELQLLNYIGKELNKKRFNDGAVSLEQDEVKFVLDEKGIPMSVYKKTRGDTNKLIEEFMLLANKKVTEHVGHDKFKDKRVFLYRIHAKPEASRMNDLATFINSLGHKIELHDGQITSRDINILLKKLEGAPERNTVATAIIRAQAKAIYSTENIGHHGLAFEHYTHFTSPIRRYPDVIVHRLIHDYLAGVEIDKKDWPKYDTVARYSSEREKAASDAERASIKYKQVEYMSYRIGEAFTATITGVTDWGIYAEEVETKCEGMIQLKSFKDDYYVLDQKNMMVIGQKTKKKFRIGDTLRVRVQNADMKKRMLDYVLE